MCLVLVAVCLYVHGNKTRCECVVVCYGDLRVTMCFVCGGDFLFTLASGGPYAGVGFQEVVCVCWCCVGVGEEITRCRRRRE